MMKEARTIADHFDSGVNNFHLLRLVAALAVIYGHAYPITGSGDQDFFLKHVGYKFIGGVAVDVFFVISGFLIASSLERSSYRRYVASRVLRIFPALIVCVALSTFVLGPLLTTSDTYWSEPATWRYFVQNATLLSTEYFLPGVFQTLPDKAINGSLWSLPLEFRLYILFFVLAVLQLMKPARFANLALFVLVVGYFWTRKDPNLVQNWTWVSCSLFFVAGGFLWHHRASVKLSYPMAALFLLLSGALLHTDRFAVAYFLTLSYLTLFIAFVPELPRIQQRDLSYGVYLYGWPAAQLVQYFRPTTTPVENTVLASALALALAFLSWTFIERPALSLKRYFR